jgi:16S rRNA G1207 methylase RsmC
MKKLLAILALCTATTVFAAGEKKEICKDTLDKAGNVVKNKDGSNKQSCKTIKVHKKAEGTKVPEPTKK